jgi:hypothetical protein
MTVLGADTKLPIVRSISTPNDVVEERPPLSKGSDPTPSRTEVKRSQTRAAANRITVNPLAQGGMIPTFTAPMCKEIWPADLQADDPPW